MTTTESTDRGDTAGAKLIPEWSVDADDQVVAAGLAVFLVLLVLLGWNAWRSDDDDVATVASSIVADPASAVTSDLAEAPILTTVTVAPAVAATDAAPTTTAPTTTTTAAAAPEIGDVQAAVADLPGAVTGSNDAAVAVIAGFVANRQESDAAEAAAAAVTGIERVQNDLVILEPAVVDALGAAGVVDASAEGTGTELVVRGTIQAEDDRQAVLDAAAEVEGVTAIEDQLEVSVAADLNALPQVQFATASAEILPTSFGDLDAAAELITSTGDVQLAVTGWTDTQGDEADNLALSQARADAVVAYLVAAGVPESSLTAIGNGETDQFGEGQSPEALQANRVVLFEQTG